jgi:RimK family alpha-L-glutamate ligase
MRLGVLAQSDSYYYRDLARAAAGDEVLPLVFSELKCNITTTNTQVQCGELDLSQLDAVIVRTMPSGSLEQVILRMDLLAVLQSQGTLIVNPPKSLETAIDKYLTSARLQLAGIPTPRTWVGQTWESALEAFERLGGKVVVKPLFGGEGRGISLLTDPDLAHRAFKMLSQLGAIIYLQEFVDHGDSDLRILFVGDECFAVKRVNPADWRSNASRGALTLPHVPSSRQLELARRAAGVVGAPICGVDILHSQAGEDLVIEVNAVPGWKATANALKIDIADRVIQWIFKELNRS